MSAWATVAIMLGTLAGGAIFNVVAVSWYLASFKEKTATELRWIKAALKDLGISVPNNGG